MVSELARQHFLTVRNYSSRNNQKVSKITIHHAAGILSAETFYRLFNNENRQASANYTIDKDGTIECLVDEDMRAWTSGSYENDSIAITIEVSNSTEEPNWEISPTVYNQLIRLCADICIRYDIIPTFTNDKNGTFTLHNMFQATQCPGKWIQEHMYQIVADVTQQMTNNSTSFDKITSPPTCEYKVHDGNEWSRWCQAGEEVYCAAGIKAICITVTNGFFKYQVHENGGRYLNIIDSRNANLADFNSGFAGNFTDIDTVICEYYTSDEVRKKLGYFFAKYKVFTTENGWYDYQYDAISQQKFRGLWQDGYAGVFNKKITGFCLELVK